MSKRMVSAAAVLAAVTAALFAAYAHATPSGSRTYALKAALQTADVIPAVKESGAVGRLSAKLTVSGKKSSLVWTLTFSNLSSAPLGAGIYVGVRGKTGPLVMTLCNRCTSGVQGSYRGSYVGGQAFVDAVVHGGSYATVRTKKNPKGEIRGQLKVTAAG